PLYLTARSAGQCRKPVVAAIHGGCVGGGVDLVTAADIRLCSQDAFFQVKEVDIGLAADVGTLQRLPKVIGSRSLVNELCLTARRLGSQEALQCGLVSRVLSDRHSLTAAALSLAATIASKSPVAVQSTKLNLTYSRDHSVQEGLDHMVAWNGVMLQSEDIMKAATAAMDRKAPPPDFAKL
ncbi:delta(3,5)-Delta(2,4)-dienoyl-CoA isomerase, mitochondrial-like, partial [Amphibalanus amphitrite]|uniref:delta(3,5)-Delta(2,4)-dienoyl-CoA isomerase, mitochondrial-like n=1 Tax=Amphibalanus amphitrite TaxID=1232801 RepID=UPI001C9277E8